MSDNISRADAIYALGEEPEIWNDTEEEWAYRNAWVEHISAIKALPSADAVPQSEQYKKGFEDAKRAFELEYARESENMRKRIAQLEVMLNAQKAISAEAEWIPCSDRLPEKGEVVLITNGKGNVRCGQYRSEHDVRDGTHYWWWKGKTVETVIAWMPLPEPYREDGK